MDATPCGLCGNRNIVEYIRVPGQNRPLEYTLEHYEPPTCTAPPHSFIFLSTGPYALGTFQASLVLTHIVQQGTKDSDDACLYVKIHLAPSIYTNQLGIMRYRGS